MCKLYTIPHPGCTPHGYYLEIKLGALTDHRTSNSLHLALCTLSKGHNYFSRILQGRQALYIDSMSHKEEDWQLMQNPCEEKMYRKIKKAFLPALLARGLKRVFNEKGQGCTKTRAHRSHSRRVVITCVSPCGCHALVSPSFARCLAFPHTEINLHLAGLEGFCSQTFRERN